MHHPDNGDDGHQLPSELRLFLYFYLFTFMLQEHASLFGTALDGEKKLASVPMHSTRLLIIAIIVQEKGL